MMFHVREHYLVSCFDIAVAEGSGYPIQACRRTRVNSTSAVSFAWMNARTFLLLVHNHGSRVLLTYGHRDEHWRYRVRNSTLMPGVLVLAFGSSLHYPDKLKVHH